MVLLKNLTEKEFTLKDMTDEERISFLNWYQGTRRKTAENILPRPVVRDGNGKLIKNHTARDFYLKLQEETFEAVEALRDWKESANDNGDYDPQTIDTKEFFAQEVTDIITVCISMLEANGIDEKQRSEMFAEVNTKNEKRGYFKED